MPEHARVAVVDEAAHHLIAVEKAVAGFFEDQFWLSWVGEIEDQKAARAGLKEGEISVPGNLDLSDRFVAEGEVAHRSQSIAPAFNSSDAETAGALGGEDEVS